MTDVIDYRGPGRRRLRRRRRLLARRAPALDHRRRGRPPAVRERDAAASGRAQNGEIYNHADAARRAAARAATCCAAAATPRSSRTSTRSTGPAWPSTCAACSPSPSGTRTRRRGVLIRDRLGIKPLYYAIVGDVVVFGSELKCVLASGLVERRARPRGDRRLPDARLRPGRDDAAQATSASSQPGRAAGRRGRPRAARALVALPGARRPTRRSAPTDEWAEIVLDKLDESVELRLMSDVPLGAMLSGGLDSSLIVALMARHMDRAASRRSRSASPARTPSCPTRAASPTRSAPTTTSSRSRSTPTPTTSPQLIWHLDEPLADLSSLGFLALCELAAEHVTVALSGQGADELFGGYRKHRVASLAEHWSRMPGRCARRRRRRAAPRPRPRRPARRRARRPPIPSRACWRRAGSCTPTCAASCSAARWPSTPAPPSASLRGRLAGAPGAAPLEAALYLDARLGLVDDMLTYFDRASMACSLEVRVPFLDHELVELCAHDPDRRTRSAACRASTCCALAARACVPDFVLDKRKRGFFNEAVGDLARRRRRRAGRRACCSAATPPTPRSSTRPRSRRAVRRVARRRARGNANLLLGARDARAVARRVPAARDGRRRPSARPRDALRYAVVTPARNEEDNLRAPRRGAGRPDATAGRVGRRRRRLDRRHAGGARRRSPPSTRGSGRSRAPAPTATSRSPTAAARARDLDGFLRRRPRRCAEPVDVVVKVDADVDFDAGLLRAADRRASPPTPTLGDRQRHLLRARGRRVGAPDQGRDAPSGAPRAPTAATAWPTSMALEPLHGLGRPRRDPRPAARPAHADVRRPAVPPPPPRGRPRADVAAPGRGARRAPPGTWATGRLPRAARALPRRQEPAALGGYARSARGTSALPSDLGAIRSRQRRLPTLLRGAPAS